MGNISIRTKGVEMQRFITSVIVLISFLIFSNIAFCEITVDVAIGRSTFVNENSLNIKAKERKLFKSLYERKMISFKEFSNDLYIKKTKDPNKSIIGIEKYSLTFKSHKDLYSFVEKELSALPGYPFYGGSEWNIAEGIFNYAAKTSDLKLYGILIKRDTHNSANEILPDLYGILRTQPETFLKAFSKLRKKEKMICIDNQHSINKTQKENSFSDEVINNLPKKLKKSAKEYNDMVKDFMKKGQALWFNIIEYKSEK